MKTYKKNTDHDFAFVLSTKDGINGKFFAHLQKNYPYLTVIGLEKDKNLLGKDGIQYARNGSVVAFQCEHDYDVDWYADETYAYINSVETELNLEDDYSDILEYLDEYAKNNYPEHYWSRKNENMGINFTNFNKNTFRPVQFTTQKGKKVTIFDSFVTDGTALIPRYVKVGKKEKFSKHEDELIGCLKSDIVYYVPSK